MVVKSLCLTIIVLFLQGVDLILAGAILLYLHHHWHPVAYGEEVPTERPAEVELGNVGSELPVAHAVLVADAGTTRELCADVLGHFMFVPFP
jgi:hypothetical protein